MRKIKNLYHLANAILANIYYRFPSRGLKVIGVTGTDGKTTTVNLIYHILKENGFNISMISTVGASIHGRREDIGLHVTTPSPWLVQKIMREIVNSNGGGEKYVILEVTSHAIDQFRVWGINFEIGVLTNITNEHLDYHKTFDNYLKTKLRLIRGAKSSVVNKDDESFNHLVKGKIKNKIFSYSLSQEADLTEKEIRIQNKSLLKFNIYNVLAASLVVKILGIDLGKIEGSIKSFKLPTGRQDVVFDNGFRVMIDFAHTPNAFEKILSSIEVEGEGRIIHVFGCAGERDAIKRPVMGGISAKYARVIILTAEDPRGEPVERIMDEIEMGIIAQKTDAQVFRISDRKEAINTAITMAKDGDFVLITGKGHEASMNLGNGEIPWNEEEVVRKALEGRNA